MNRRSAALHRRWSDPAYCERQTAVNRANAAAQKALYANPLERALQGQRVKVGWRMRKRKEGR